MSTITEVHLMEHLTDISILTSDDCCPQLMSVFAVSQRIPSQNTHFVQLKRADTVERERGGERLSWDWAETGSRQHSSTVSLGSAPAPSSLLPPTSVISQQPHQQPGSLLTLSASPIDRNSTFPYEKSCQLSLRHHFCWTGQEFITVIWMSSWSSVCCLTIIFLNWAAVDQNVSWKLSETDEELITADEENYSQPDRTGRAGILHCELWWR